MSLHELSFLDGYRRIAAMNRPPVRPVFVPPATEAPAQIVGLRPSRGEQAQADVKAARAELERKIAAAAAAPELPRITAPFSTAREIVSAVADEFELSIYDLLGPSRRAECVAARFEAMWRIREAHGWGYPRIGRFFGGRDHTSALHAIRKMARLKGRPIPSGRK